MVMVQASSGPITGVVTSLLYQPTPPGQGWVTGASITRPATWERIIQRHPRADRARQRMHHDDRAVDAEFVERIDDHPRLHVRRQILHTLADASAVAGPVDQDHTMMGRKPPGERPHHLQI